MLWSGSEILSDCMLPCLLHLSLSTLTSYRTLKWLTKCNYNFYTDLSSDVIFIISAEEENLRLHSLCTRNHQHILQSKPHRDWKHNYLGRGKRKKNTVIRLGPGMHSLTHTDIWPSETSQYICRRKRKNTEGAETGKSEREKTIQEESEINFWWRNV